MYVWLIDYVLSTKKVVKYSERVHLFISLLVYLQW